MVIVVLDGVQATATQVQESGLCELKVGAEIIVLFCGYGSAVV